jgi:hypothetical protein
LKNRDCSIMRAASMRSNQGKILLDPVNIAVSFT